MPARPVVSLSDPEATAPSLVGGKGANLARLLAGGLPIPPGFCVTTEVFHELVDDPEIRDAIMSLNELDAENAEAIASASANVRSIIRDGEFTEPVRTAIADAVAEVGASAYAVRSSATAEDLPTASFAGQHETFLGVRGPEAVAERVHDCMASLFTARAVTYRLRNHIKHDEVAMAAVVQAMVEPSVAGVLFTADPLSGNRHVASVDASFGLGEALVSGAVTADNARVDRRTGEVLSYDVGEKDHLVQTRGEGGGTVTIEIEPDRRTARALSDDQLRSIVQLGDRVEAVLSGPQDVEWAIVDGDVRLLQARPITSLVPLPTPAPTDERLHVYLSFGHVQAMPEALPPLVVDRWREFINAGAGAISEQAREGRFAVASGGRVYLDLTSLLRIGPIRRGLPDRLAAVSPPAAEGLRELLVRRPTAFARRWWSTSTLGVARALERFATLLVAVGAVMVDRFVTAFVVDPPDPERERRWVETWGSRLAAEVREPEDLHERVEGALHRHDFSQVFGELFPRIMSSVLAGIAAGKLLRRLVPDADDDLDAIGKGFPAEIVTQMNQRLGDVADVAREHPAIADAIERGAPLSEIEGVEGGGEFADALAFYLDEFGHRGTGEIDLRRPRWRDDPTALVQTIRGNLAGEEPGRHRGHLRMLQRRAEAATDRLAARADRGPFGPVRAALVRRLVRTYRGGIQLREYPKQGMAHLFDALRDVFVEAGEYLAAEGRLDRPDDVWFLHAEELLAALDGGALTTVNVEARRRDYRRDRSLEPPPIVTSEGEDLTTLAASDVPPGTLLGTPVSAGIVEGRARVVLDPGETVVEPGEIIVAPSCDPGWTPLFLNAAGLVMEVGGRMTHGALVAREYGIPAVVSVRDATETIQTGERIRVDGTRGTVERLDGA